MTQVGKTPYGNAYVEPGPGRPERFELRSRIVAWSFEDNEAKTDVLSLQLDNDDLVLFDQPAISTGNMIVFTFGFGELRAWSRRFVIRKVSGGRELTLECHSKEVLLDSEPRKTVFTNMTVSEAVTAVLRNAGFAAEQLAITATTALLPTQNMAGRTDAQFIARAARRLGWIYYWDNEGIYHFQPRAIDEPPQIVLGYRTTADGAHPFEDFSLDTEIVRRPGKVVAAGRDPDTKADVEAFATDATEADRPVLSKYRGTFDPEDGALVVGTQPVGSVGQSANALAGAATSAAEVAEVAKGEFNDAVQHGVELSLTCPGHPLLSSRTVVRVIGIGARLSGSYWVRKTTHAGSAGTYTTALELITEGFQRGRGSGGGGSGGGDPSALPGAWVSAELAASLDPAATPQLIDMLDTIGSAMVAGWENDPGTVATIAAQATRAAQMAQQIPATEAAAALAEFAALAKNSKPLGSDETAGAVNTQDPEAPTGVKHTAALDPDTGDLVVSYRPS